MLLKISVNHKFEIYICVWFYKIVLVRFKKEFQGTKRTTDGVQTGKNILSIIQTLIIQN